jgi:hypothetical protein
VRSPREDTSVAEPPRRVVITSARRTATRQRPQVVTQEIDDQTGVGDAYMRSLVRTQLRLAITVLFLLTITLGGLPLLFSTVPASRSATILGVPLPWLLLGVLVYPVLTLVGWLYVRQAERNEQAFSELVDRV